MEAIPAGVKNLKVLEVGGAWGYLSFLLASQGATVTASDIMMENVVFGSKVRQLNANNGAVQFCAADALSLPFPDASFDAIISMEMIEHIHGGLEGVCVEFARVTRPGGYVILSTPNPKGVAQVVKTRLKKILALRRRYSFLDYPNEWFISSAELVSAAARARLKLVTLRRTGLMVPFTPDWLFPLNLIVEKVFALLPVLLTTNIFVLQRY